MNVIFTCGGTAGHVNPALALAGYMQERHPDLRVLFVGTPRGMERGLIEKAGYDFRSIEVSSFQRSLSPSGIAHNVKSLKNLALAGSRARAILRDFRPDLVVGTGGYASYPMVKYAAKEGIPTAVHESNMVPGLTTKMLEGYAGCIMVGFEECRQHYKHPEKIVVTGTPVRGDFFRQTKEQARQKLGLTDDRPLAVSFWGSLGARFMNEHMLDFFRLDNGKEQPKLLPCRISTITHTLETEFMPVAMNKGLSLTVKNGNDAVVLTDKERIIQIGNNLLSNAIKFTEKGGVSLTIDYTNGVLTLIFEDTGTGMTEDEQQRVFGAFERLSNAAAKDGFGLGLAIVHNIVAMLDGKIHLESEKGKGSRFTVEIPMQKAEEIPEKEIQTYIHREERNLNVVAIDNDEVLLLMLKEMYAQEGIHCDTCTDAAELMEMIRRKEYNLLLTDLNMPGINGFELLELLRSSNVGNSQTIPVVVATASGSCDAEELLERGFAGCLFKPFSISELLEMSDKCAIKATQDGKPDFSALLSYGNEVVMLEKLITETEKEMQAVRDAAMRNDLQELDALTHHLRSSWEILRADQPLKVLYGVLHGKDKSDNEALSNSVTTVLDKGAEIIQLAKEERRKYENG